MNSYIEINGLYELRPITGTAGPCLLELDGDGNLMPATGTDPDHYLELDGNGDIMPRFGLTAIPGMELTRRRFRWPTW